MVVAKEEVSLVAIAQKPSNGAAVGLLGYQTDSLLHEYCRFWLLVKLAGTLHSSALLAVTGRAGLRLQVLAGNSNTNLLFPVSMVEFLKKAGEKIPNFVGLKFTSRDCAEAGNCMLLRRPNGKPFNFLFGSDETYLGHYGFGIESAIGSSYNFAPQLFHQINEAWAQSNVVQARQLQSFVTRMFYVLFKNGKPGLVQQKMAMKILTGLDLGPPRFPQIPMKSEHIEELKKDLLDLKINAYQA